MLKVNMVAITAVHDPLSGGPLGRHHLALFPCALRMRAHATVPTWLEHTESVSKKLLTLMVAFRLSTTSLREWGTHRPCPSLLPVSS